MATGNIMCLDPDDVQPLGVGALPPITIADAARTVILTAIFSDFTWQALVDSPMSLWGPLLIGFFGLLIALKVLGVWAMLHSSDQH